MAYVGYELLSTDVYPMEPPDPSVQYVPAYAREFFIRRVRVGMFWQWEVWWRHGDCRIDAYTNAICWRALWGVRFWRRINALRCAADMRTVHTQTLLGYQDWREGLVRQK